MVCVCVCVWGGGLRGASLPPLEEPESVCVHGSGLKPLAHSAYPPCPHVPGYTHRFLDKDLRRTGWNGVPFPAR